jgi:hypothetical protein
VSQIQLCEQYLSNAQTSYCTKCADGYFSNLGVSCLQRVLSTNINNCTTINELSDSC